MPALRKLQFEADDGSAGFRAQLNEQRWDDHRFYHHSLVNQSLHFVSACTFLTAYVLLFKDPALYNNSNQMLVETRELVKSIRENPKKYLTFHVKVF